MRTDPWRILGVHAGASRSEIKRAYRELAKRHHPDHGGNAESFHELRFAYLRLTDELPWNDLSCSGDGAQDAGIVPFVKRDRRFDVTYQANTRRWDEERRKPSQKEFSDFLREAMSVIS